MNTQETEQAIVSFIKEKYNPLAIILHGSRANGHAREHSDWDIVLITKEEVDAHREILGDANIEYTRIITPISESKFYGFKIRTGNTKILFDTDGIAEKLITQNDTHASMHNPMPESGQKSRYAYFISAINGMRDDAADPLKLFDKKLDFYTRIVPTWFSLHKSQNQPSGYLAFPIIEKEDPVMYKLIQDFVATYEASELIRIGNEIIAHFFPKLARK